MVYRKATYEEYCKASKFRRFKYRFGVYVQIVALFLFLFLIYYTVTNIEEMKANPIGYAEEKMGVICYAPLYILPTHYGSRGNTEDIRER